MSAQLERVEVRVGEEEVTLTGHYSDGTRRLEWIDRGLRGLVQFIGFAWRAMRQGVRFEVID